MAPLSLRAEFAVAPDTPELQDGEVHVWAVPLTAAIDDQEALLSPAELDRAERFRFADHRRRYTICRGALRCILGGYTGEPPAALQFETAPRGKPRLLGQRELEFNLSHSGQLALVGVGRRPLGVDLEKTRELQGFVELAHRHFSDFEFEALQELPEAQRLLGFYRCWTRKEAWIKALGQGLSEPLDSFDVSLADEAGLLALRDRDERLEEWSLRDVSPADDYVAAVAVRHPGCTVRRFRFGG